MEDYLKGINRTVAILIVLVNIYFLPFTFITIKESGGAMGCGYLGLPITLFINFLIITAVFAFREKYEKSIPLLVINGIGLLFSACLLLLLIATPRID